MALWTVTTPGQAMVCPVLVGREEALRALRAALDASRGAPVARVFGEAGVGKTRLVAEALRGVAGRRVLRVASYEADRLLPLAPFLDLLTDTDLPGAEELVQRIGAHARGGAQAHSPEAALARRRLFDDLTDTLLDADTLLVLEDLHWSDQATLDAVAHLARCAPAGVRLVITYRDDEPSPALESFLAGLERARLVVDVSLRRLPREEVAAMAHATTGAWLRRRSLDVLVEATEGNPYLVEELLAVVAAAPGGELDAGELPIPRTVQEVVRRRFEGLGSDAQQVAFVAATAGRRFDADLIGALLGMGDAALAGALRDLVAVGLAVQTAGGTMEFRHELTRRAVYERLIGHERRRLHQQIAEALAHAAGQDDARAGDLARHYHLAGAWEQALVWSERAGRRAEALYAPRAAAEQYDRAVDAARRLGRAPAVDLLQARARVRELVGDLDAAIVDHEEALRAAHERSDSRAAWQSLLALGGLWVSRDWDRAERWLDEALTLCHELDDPVAIGRTLNRQGNLRMVRGEQDHARRLHEQALRIFERLDAPHDRAATLDLVAVTTLYAGDLAAARSHYERVERLFADLDDRPAIANALTMRALCGGAHFLQTFVPAPPGADSVALAEQACRIARETGWHGESFTLYGLASVLAETGRLGAALDRGADALRLAAEIDHLPWLVLARYVRGMTLLDALAPGDALAELDAAAHQAGSFHGGVFLAAALAGRARAETALGRLDDAAASIERAQQSAPGLLSARAALHARVALDLAAGEPARALQVVDRLIDSAPRAERRPPPVLAQLRGESLLALGRVDDAGRAFERAADDAEAFSKPVVQWQALAGLADAHQRAGREGQARDTARAAVRLVDRLAAGLAPERRRDFRGRARARIPGVALRADKGEQYAGLTPRQREVAALLARGLTNREIAETLVISPLTAETHVKHILTRLGFASRAQVAAWVVDKGLAAGEDD